MQHVLVLTRGVVLALLWLSVKGDAPASNCCATCLDSIAAFNFDPTKWNVCVGRACCFCNKPDPGTPTFDPLPMFVRDIPQIETGETIRFVWPGVVNVTYVIVQGEKKALPKLRDAAMKRDGDAFVACFDSVGTIFYRGWSSDPCNSASSELAIQVVPGTSNNTCAADAPPSKNQTTCNLQRAALHSNGECVCSWFEYSGPPGCTDPSIYKILAIVISALAGLIAIVSATIKCWRKQQALKTADTTKSLSNPDPATAYS
ncbi:hypothetical protein LEN26_000134 [Aphanomyces euteiches]|nr:hypothetical protein AeMF1_011265 [Aphanomyces euteiches]KAH9164237.1 hypothetical protein LEN26_000134 [Aphanomyces euteiches]KAH9182460.1 hypothetical protein AeNC1_015566 [Aphanomyces euteiches]